ncbi:MAG: R3H domain-containing nucleic acid-binding protein [Cyanobacteria bacterium J06635_15]
MADERHQTGAQWLQELLGFAGLTVSVDPKVVVDDLNDGCWLTIDETKLAEGQVEALIGERGAVLDSIQYLANTVLNLGLSREEQQAYTVELAGYRARRQNELKAIASKAAEAVKETQQEYEIASLSSAERRQVHNFLTDYEGLETFSRGKEPDRRLVVRLVEVAE